MSTTFSNTSDHGLDAVSDVPLQPGREVSSAFLEHGCHGLQEAFLYVWRLPYGRNAKAADPLAPLRESRGTCSTKHALLARLAAEQGFDIELRLGIYLMSEANTPGVGATLAAFGIEAVPEAHCVLVRDGVCIDVTRDDRPAAEPIAPFLHEERITPDQVGDYKRSVHGAFMERWSAAGNARGYGPEQLWAIREACIVALGE